MEYISKKVAAYGQFVLVLLGIQSQDFKIQICYKNSNAVLIK